MMMMSANRIDQLVIITIVVVIAIVIIVSTALLAMLTTRMVQSNGHSAALTPIRTQERLAVAVFWIICLAAGPQQSSSQG